MGMRSASGARPGRWRGACRTWMRRGKYITLDLSTINVSIFVARVGDGKLNVFFNIYPHCNGRLICNPLGKKAESYYDYSVENT